MVKHAVILAGGSGTRLWPASLHSCPKQFLALNTEYSLFQQTLLRTLSLGIDGDVLIVTNANWVDQLREQMSSCLDSPAVAGKSGLPPAYKWPRRIIILPEPVAKNTAPAIVYACHYLKEQGEDAGSLLVLASDHYIEPFTAFRADVEQAAGLAAEGYLVTFGIPPRGPDTGYGYLEAGTALAAGSYKIKFFHEKPDLKKAKAYIRKKNFFWNSGIFCFKIDTLLAQAGRHAPAVLAAFQAPGKIRQQEAATAKPACLLACGELPLFIESGAAAQAAFTAAPAISIDYAIMEKTTSAAMVASHFQWSDIGSWDEVSLMAEPLTDPAGQAATGLHHRYNAENCFIHADIPVAIAGVDDLIVIVKNGRVLICPRGKSQLVSKLIKDMEEKGRRELI